MCLWFELALIDQLHVYCLFVGQDMFGMPHLFVFRAVCSLLAFFDTLSHMRFRVVRSGHVLHSLKDPTPKRVAQVTHAVCAMFFFFGTLLALCGYLIFFDSVQANILDNFARSDLVTQICRIALVFNVLIGVPYSTFMPRVALQAYVQLYKPNWINKSPNNKCTRTIVHATLTTLVLAGALTIALLVTNLGNVYSFVGGLSALGISLILPPLCFLKLEPDAPRSKRAVCIIVIVCISLSFDPLSFSRIQSDGRSVCVRWLQLCGLVGSIGCTASLVASWSSSS